MLLYRVFRYRSTAKPGESGHPLFVFKPQTSGRWDNPGEYDTWYLARAPECAVGETFGDLRVWREATFSTLFPDDTRRVLGTFEVPDTIALLDLDDARNLFDRHLRPTQIAIRNRPATQSIALEAFREKNADGTRKWAGLSWWSTRWPAWTPICLWASPTDTPPHTLVDIQDLTTSHPAVADAARTLAKPL